jgi:hypothetical protein
LASQGLLKPEIDDAADQFTGNQVVVGFVDLVEPIVAPIPATSEAAAAIASGVANRNDI